MASWETQVGLVSLIMPHLWSFWSHKQVGWIPLNRLTPPTENFLEAAALPSHSRHSANTWAGVPGVLKVCWLWFPGDVISQGGGGEARPSLRMGQVFITVTT